MLQDGARTLLRAEQLFLLILTMQGDEPSHEMFSAFLQPGLCSLVYQQIYKKMIRFVELFLFYGSMTFIQILKQTIINF
jgi:hypothetical protein